MVVVRIEPAFADRDGAIGEKPLQRGEITDGIEDILDEEVALVVEALDVNART